MKECRCFAVSIHHKRHCGAWAQFGGVVTSANFPATAHFQCNMKMPLIMTLYICMNCLSNPFDEILLVVAGAALGHFRRISRRTKRVATT